MPLLQPSSTAISRPDTSSVTSTYTTTPTTALASTTTAAITASTVFLGQAGYTESMLAQQDLFVAVIGFGIGYSFAVFILCACYARRFRQAHAERAQVQNLSPAQTQDHGHCLHCVCATGPSGLGIPIELDSSSFATRSRSMDNGAAGSMTTTAATAAVVSSRIFATEAERHTTQQLQGSRGNSSTLSGNNDDDETFLSTDRTSTPRFSNGTYDGVISNNTRARETEIEVSPSKTSNGPHGTPRLALPQTQQGTMRAISSTASDIAFWYDIARRYANSYETQGSEAGVQNTPQTHSATSASVTASYISLNGTTKIVEDDRGDDESIVDPPLHDAELSKSNWKKHCGTGAGTLGLHGEEIVVYLSSEPHIMASNSNCGIAPTDTVVGNYQMASPPFHSTEMRSSESAVSMEEDMDMGTNIEMGQLSIPSSALSLTTGWMIDRRNTFGQPLSRLENYAFCEDTDVESLTQTSGSVASNGINQTRRHQ